MIKKETRGGSEKSLSREDFERIRNWNDLLPSPIERCVHHLFQEKVQEHPNAVAICSRDGSLTYEELDAHATVLARRLIHNGIQAESLVPLCFEKSMWAVVAMIAVLKAGAAFVPVPCSPRGRIETILAQIDPSVILTSSLQAAKFEGRSQSVIIVGPESGLDGGDRRAEVVDVVVCSGNLAYVLFTSGSTGVPKVSPLSIRCISVHDSLTYDIFNLLRERKLNINNFALT